MTFLVARRRAVAAGVLIGLLLIHPSRLPAQEVTAPALKAAYLFNFVKFTTWPDDALPDGDALSMCVVNAPAVGRALTDAVQGRVVSGHAIRVTQAARVADLRGCHVLFVSGSRAAAAEAVNATRGTAVLTVSDLPAFTDDGGIVQLFVQQGNLRFTIKIEAARAARLQISSKLLALSRKP